MTTIEREARIVEQVPKQVCIGGHWRDAQSGATFKVEDPATGSVLCEVADAGVADGMAALEMAAATQPRGPSIRLGSAGRSCGAPTSSSCTAKRTWQCS